MKIKILKQKINLSVTFFVLIYSFRGFTDAIFVSKGIKSGIWINVKYILLIAGIINESLILIKNNHQRVARKETISLISTIFLLTIISLVECFNSGKMYLSLWDNIIKMTLPAIYVFLIINNMSFDQIYNAMGISLIISFIAYILEIGINNFNISNILVVSFQDSYSAFESHYSAGVAIAMCAFFMYYRKNKIYQIISLLFTILTFKRLFVLFSIFLLIGQKVINLEVKIKKNSQRLCAILFVIFTFVYIWMLNPSTMNLFEKIFKQDPNKFTMGRYGMLYYLDNKGYISSGLGSVDTFLGRGLEMDLIRIYKETTIIGLVIFCFGYFECSGDNRYTLYYMCFEFFNMLTSHSIYGSFNWILILLTIYCIKYKKKNVTKHKRNIIYEQEIL